jgi:hypothetical protein
LLRESLSLVVIGIIDESTPWLTAEHDQVLYALALVVAPIAGDDGTGDQLRSSLNRKRPFHWESDTGPNVRRLIVGKLIATSTFVVVAAATCRRKEQMAMRSELLTQNLLPAAEHFGVIRLVVERQSRRENEADVRTVRDWPRAQHRGWRPVIEHVDKNEPLTWLADAASGLWSDALLNRDRGHLAPLIGSGRVTSATWMPRWMQ